MSVEAYFDIAGALNDDFYQQSHQPDQGRSEEFRPWPCWSSPVERAGSTWWMHVSRQLDAAQLLVLFDDELIADPGIAAVQLGEFLDLDPMPLLGGLPSENPAVGPRTPSIQRARTRPIGKAARALLLPALRRAVRGAITRDDNRPPIDPETADLLADCYRVPNAALAELTGREVSW